MTAHSSILALENIEVITMTKKKIPTLSPVVIDEVIKESKLTVKYFGLALNWKMNFSEQGKTAWDKTIIGISCFNKIQRVLMWSVYEGLKRNIASVDQAFEVFSSHRGCGAYF